ncbi:uncharacterized protein LOC144584515 [Pogona vitticeps]
MDRITRERQEQTEETSDFRDSVVVLVPQSTQTSFPESLVISEVTGESGKPVCKPGKPRRRRRNRKAPSLVISEVESTCSELPAREAEEEKEEPQGTLSTCSARTLDSMVGLAPRSAQSSLPRAPSLVISEVESTRSELQTREAEEEKEEKQRAFSACSARTLDSMVVLAPRSAQSSLPEVPSLVISEVESLVAVTSRQAFVEEEGSTFGFLSSSEYTSPFTLPNTPDESESLPAQAMVPSPSALAEALNKLLKEMEDVPPLDSPEEFGDTDTLEDIPSLEDEEVDSLADIASLEEEEVEP